MDTLGALALATEPPTDNLMKRHPVGRRHGITSMIAINTFVFLCSISSLGVQKQHDILSNLPLQGPSCDKCYVEKPFYPGL